MHYLFCHVFGYYYFNTHNIKTRFRLQSKFSFTRCTLIDSIKNKTVIIS